MTADFSVIDLLDFSLGVCDLESNDLQSPVKRHYVREAEQFLLSIDKIYFSGEYPSVYFKSVPDFSPDVEKELLKSQKSIWNQGRVPFLYVESPTEIRIFNCYEKPVFERDKDRTIKDITLFSASKQVESDLQELKAVFDKISIDTGSFWKQLKYAEKVKYEKRVEQALIDNLKRTSKKLESVGLNIEIVHDLLLRSLFLLYLEDRGATNATFYDEYKKNATSYFHILEDKEATYELFEKLEDSFNGNLCPILESEKDSVTLEHLEIIKQCFWSPIKEGGQLLLFAWARIFDFAIIPIELISSIYENFLAKEDGEDKQAKSGAYYTPRPLAEFILNHVLPYPSVSDSKFNVKILDPTCGSGMFLVESLNRLLDRWEFANPDNSLDFDTIQQIVLDNIYGVEKEKEALKVAAFSIYLAMLNRLDPIELWKTKQFPYLIFEPESKDNDKQGRNLFRMSSIGKGSFEDVEYDLVVGNPPFKRGGIDEDIDKYLDKKGYAKEMVLAFLDRATTLCPLGKIAMIFPAKILFNTGKPYQKFRKFLFNDTYVEQVYNFSILRRIPKSEGRNLFASAVSPVGVLVYSKQFPENPSDRLTYCAPKSVIKNRFIDGIAIDATDVKYLPRIECQKPDTKIWKAAMWGTERDFKSIKSLQNITLLEFLETQGHSDKAGVGFETSFPKEIIDYEIREIPHIEAKKVEQYYTPLSQTRPIEDFQFYLTGKKIAYKTPHILIKEGQSDKRFCASYLDYACSFRKTIYGIHIPNNDNLLKLMTAFLNSKLASYLIFLQSASWGVERERVNPNEVLNLPALFLSLDEATQILICDSLDNIIKLINTGLARKEQIKQIEYQIDNLFYQGLKLTTTQEILIEDLLNLNLDAFQEKTKSLSYNPCIVNDTKYYVEFLTKTINDFLKFGSQLSSWATAFALSPNTPLNIVAIHLNKEQDAGYIEENTEAKINQILKEIEAYTYQKYSESIYYRKFIRYYKNDIIYIIKPNEKRFWSRSLALNDADEIILEVTTAQTNGRTN